ncbi:Uncharacterised protein [Raoultella planticola]|nr:Uncharacterised protein [Raoultella planticola]
MNLARVEYYFADFLSKLEERNEQPTIQLYSDDEAAHVLAELKGVVSVISNAQEKFSKMASWTSLRSCKMKKLTLK